MDVVKILWCKNLENKKRARPKKIWRMKGKKFHLQKGQLLKICCCSFMHFLRPKENCTPNNWKWEPLSALLTNAMPRISQWIFVENRTKLFSQNRPEKKSLSLELKLNVPFSRRRTFCKLLSKGTAKMLCNWDKANFHHYCCSPQPTPGLTCPAKWQ